MTSLVQVRLCPLCNSPLRWEVQTSFDQAFEDYHEWCSQKDCKYERWVDGIDS